MNDSISILIAFLILVFLLRWLFVGNSHSTSDDSQQRRTQNDRRRNVTPEMVQVVQQMFPQIPAAAIYYDLQRTGSVQSTCDKILQEGDLPMPPAHVLIPRQYQQQQQQQSSLPNGSIASGSSTSSSLHPSKPSLVQRFNLSSKLDVEVKEPPKVWESTANKRQRLLQERKEAMILAARKKLLENNKTETGLSSSSSTKSSSEKGTSSGITGKSTPTYNTNGTFVDHTIPGRNEPLIKSVQDIVYSEPDFFRTKEDMDERITEMDVEAIAQMLE